MTWVSALLIGILGGLLTSLIVQVIPRSLDQARRRLASSERGANEILDRVGTALRALDEEGHGLGRFHRSYGSLVFSTDYIALAEEWVRRHETRLRTRLSSGEMPLASECAVLSLYSSYSAHIERIIRDIPEAIRRDLINRVATHASGSSVYQQIATTLALGVLFPDTAVGRAEALLGPSSRTRVVIGEWLVDSSTLPAGVASVEGDEIICAFHIGNHLRVRNRFEHWLGSGATLQVALADPRLYASPSLMQLRHELSSPPPVVESAGYIGTERGDFQIDFVRKVFQICANIAELKELGKRRQDVRTQCFLYQGTQPSIAFMAARQAQYLEFYPASFENAKYLAKFKIITEDAAHVGAIMDEFRHDLLRASAAKDLESGRLPSELPSHEWKARPPTHAVWELSMEGGVPDEFRRKAIAHLAQFLVDRDLGTRDVDAARVSIQKRGAHYPKSWYLELKDLMQR